MCLTSIRLGVLIFLGLRPLCDRGDRAPPSRLALDPPVGFACGRVVVVVVVVVVCGGGGSPIGGGVKSLDANLNRERLESRERCGSCETREEGEGEEEGKHKVFGLV